MNQFIIVTHGKLAEGFYNSVLFFNKAIDNLHFINAYLEESTFEQSFVRLVEKLSSSHLIVFTDLPGGSVNQIICHYIDKYHLRIVSGVNLPLLLELVMKETIITDEQLRVAIAESQKQLVFMNDAFTAMKGEDELD